MKEKIKTFFCVFFLLCALPYIITMCFRQSASSEGTPKGDQRDTDNVPLPTGAEEGEEPLDVEKYLVGVVAKEIPITFETEALKAQVVIARTNLMSAMEKGEELPEGLSQEELMELWGDEGFGANYQRLTDAVEATRGVTIKYQGAYIYAAFHAVSAGKTRAAGEALGKEDMAYLTAVDSPSDISSTDFLKVIYLEKEELVQRLTAAFSDWTLDASDPLSGISITLRDSSDYVVEVKNGEKAVSGENFRNALDLSSACFYLKEVEGKIRIVTKGLGHGLGMSQYGANGKAREGADYPEILSYYFKNVEISD